MTVAKEYQASPWEWVRNQVEVYESSDGTDGTTLRDTGLPVDRKLRDGAQIAEITHLVDLSGYPEAPG